ncbi:MAG TPA: asparaginase domain-containing protein [bacterium]|nr:asparaginase domain-containing protein [bacterium]
MPPKKHKVFVITTGGTIEKIYDEESGTLTNRGSLLQQMLSRLRLPYTTIQSYDLLCKDSLEMTDKDRQMILFAVENLLEHSAPILILHGTDTMELTADYLFRNLPDLKVPIILTGAMKPFGFDNSDALQNFTEALLACSLSAPGLYISMHGCVHPLPGVFKNREKGTFERKEQNQINSPV